VAVFPEGTTGTGAALMPFYPALAQAAVDAAAVVQTVAIRYLDAFGALNLAVPFIGDRTFVDSLGKIIGEREIIAEVSFSDPISVAGVTRREIMAQAQRLIADTLGVPASSLPPDPRSLRLGLTASAVVDAISPPARVTVRRAAAAIVDNGLTA
jgi:1-acyl-sn-glycerol-3-phosphate acyltransferase